MELASSFVVLLLLTGGSALTLQELEEDLILYITDEEMSGGSASGLQEPEEDPTFDDNHEEMSGGSASGSQEKKDPAFDDNDEEMSGGNKLPPPLLKKLYFSSWPGGDQLYKLIPEGGCIDICIGGSASGLQEPEEDPSSTKIDEEMSGGSATLQELEEDLSLYITDIEMSGGSASGLQEPEKDPAFDNNDEEISGGSASGLQEPEEDPAFDNNDEEMSGRNQLSPSVPEEVCISLCKVLPERPLISGLLLPEQRTVEHTRVWCPEISKMIIDPATSIVTRRMSFTEREVVDTNCQYQAVLDYLCLSQDKDKFRMSRPVRNHKNATQVELIMAISAILDVRETDQTFISYIWIHMIWNNEFIYWDPEDFCDIEHVLVPTNILWKPDIVIEEMIEKDKAPPSELLKIRSNGDVEYRNDLVVLSTCKMQVYKFPFDVQSCNISFKSLMHSDEELYFVFSSNATLLTDLSRKVMQTQYEWLFIKMTVTSKTDSISIDSNQTSVIHTIYMKRRALLYIANFLMPILFFLCLDLSSFLISDSGGEKVGFKVTVLLAVTVMQLILNEILPCSSERIPLIAVYCIGIFTLMMLSLLETILVMHLMEKDAASAQDNETTRDHKLMKYTQTTKASIFSCFKEICGNYAAAGDVQADQTPSVVKEDSRTQLTEVSLALGKISDELEQIEKSMTALSDRKQEKKQGGWTRVVKTINKVFLVFYLTAVTVFLIVIFTLWSLPDEEE